MMDLVADNVEPHREHLHIVFPDSADRIEHFLVKARKKPARGERRKFPMEL